MNIDNTFVRSHFHKVFKFNIEFQVTGSSERKTKGKYLFHADGYIDGILKFQAVAVFNEVEQFEEFKKIKDIFDREWITENALEIIPKYESGVLTLRGLHYQLVGRGMINHDRLYKRTVSAMIEARRNGLVPYESFSDHDRSMIGSTEYDETDLDEEVETGKRQIKAWMNNYSKNKWENQPWYVEVFIEKKALQGVFGKPCDKNEVALGACKGYPSLTFLNDTADRFIRAKRHDKKLVIIYFGDYDPSGEDIPRSIGSNLEKDFGVDVKVHCVALNEEQVIEWNLPPAPAKTGDSRTANWDGLGQVELDAVAPEKLVELCQDAIDEYFDEELHEELMETEKDERRQYRQELRTFVNNLNDE